MHFFSFFHFLLSRSVTDPTFASTRELQTTTHTHRRNARCPGLQCCGCGAYFFGPLILAWTRLSSRKVPFCLPLCAERSRVAPFHKALVRRRAVDVKSGRTHVPQCHRDMKSYAVSTRSQKHLSRPASAPSLSISVSVSVEPSIHPSPHSHSLSPLSPSEHHPRCHHPPPNQTNS